MGEARESLGKKDNGKRAQPIKQRQHHRNSATAPKSQHRAMGSARLVLGFL
jgi:hypothetical protein